jgi:hypothetical protein
MKSQEISRPRPTTGTVSPTDTPQEKPFTDPVCGMKAAANPEKSATHDGQTYYFCSKGSDAAMYFAVKAFACFNVMREDTQALVLFLSGFRI